MAKTKKELEVEVTELTERVAKLETQFAGLATVFKGMLEVAQEEKSDIVKPGIELLTH